jgi:segregation and condensation protein B
MKKNLEQLKGEIESILFASAKIVNLAELRQLTKADDEAIRSAVLQLTEDYDKKDSSLTVADYEDAWKLTVKNSYMSIVEQVVTETELPKSILETLAVIAFRHPIVQSDVVKIRSNKAYEHLNALEELGFIRREKYGRTNRIHLTQKFFDYFELPPGKLKEAFASFNAVSRAIDEKEKELELKEQDIQQVEKEQKDARKDKKKIGILDVYDSPMNPEDFIQYDEDGEEFIDESAGIQEGVENSDSEYPSNRSEYVKEPANSLFEKDDLFSPIEGESDIPKSISAIDENHSADKKKGFGSRDGDQGTKKRKHFNLNLYTPDDVDLSIIPHDKESEDTIASVTADGEKVMVLREDGNMHEITVDSSETSEKNVNEYDNLGDDSDEETIESDPDIVAFNEKVDKIADRLMGKESGKEEKKKTGLDDMYEDLENTKDSLNK